MRFRGQVRKFTVLTLSIVSLKPTGQFYIKSDQKGSHEVGQASSVCVCVNGHQLTVVVLLNPTPFCLQSQGLSLSSESTDLAT